ncbi:MAG: 4'-phosphopantetheinyl transferase superfamily protein [Elusimicrobia bacterium]|nr:4'-phosphopantetheinyl transferase superfamily protein [Elusimicrobiota bacterium]
MIPSTPSRPPYRLAFCPRAEAERALALPDDVRARFSASELADLESLPERRRRDRLAGRLAAKRALAAHFAAEHGWDAEPRELAVFNDESGRPFLRLPAGAPAEAPSFSIAHSSAGGICAVAAPGRRVGADIETVVARPLEVLAFVSTPDELAGATPSNPEAQARVWTGKEAALKLLGLGLDADARAVRAADGDVAYTGAPADAWRALGSPRVRLKFERAGTAMISVAYTGD